MTTSQLVRVQDSLIGGVINAVINGAISYNGFKAETTVPLSLDLISTQQHSVWGTGVSLAFALGIILSLITAKMFVKHVAKSDDGLAERLKKPWSFLIKVAVGNAAALFGWFVALAVLWQRMLGTIQVGPVLAAVLVALLALIITVIVEMRTKQALVDAL